MNVDGIWCILKGSWGVLADAYTLDFNKLEHGCSMISAPVLSFVALGLEDGHVPTFWLVDVGIDMNIVALWK